MITVQEAWERARAWASAAHGGREVEVGLHPFELGYVAWVVTPSPNPSGPPPATGMPTVVIDGQTGDLSRCRSLPESVIAAGYTAAREAERRFPANVRRALEDGGWYPGRDVSAEVDRWLSQNAAALDPFECSDAARRILCEFGGLLQVPQYGRRRTSYDGFANSFHPLPREFYPLSRHASSLAETVEGVMEDTGTPMFPVGMSEDEGADLAVSPEGRLMMLHWGGDFSFGVGDDAITNLVYGNSVPTDEYCTGPDPETPRD